MAYIDKDKIPYYLDTSEEAPIEGRMIAFKSEIDKLPTADVVEVVRCKDCYWSKRHRKLFGEDVCDCAKWPSNDAHRVKAFDDYCSDAYRRSEKND